MKAWMIFTLVFAFLCPWPSIAAGAEEPVVAGNVRCPVCGMFVAKYPQWLTQLTLSDGRTETFDGVKDMMAYAFSPESYGAAPGVTVGEVRVRDYYSQKWIDGRRASYVIGSDVLGPMGHELIPFAEPDHAESFLRDHKGGKILRFPDITRELIDSLRRGHTMLGHGRKQKD